MLFYKLVFVRSCSQPELHSFFHKDMAEKDLPSNSDESDEDFVPEGNPTSDEDSLSGHTGDESNDEKGPKSKKRRKLSKKKKKGEDESKTSDENEETSLKTTDVDALWADFKQDVSKMEKKVTEEKLGDKSSDTKGEKPNEGNSNTSKTVPEGKKRTFPGAVNSGSKLGLNKILNQLGKKEKMSTLAKSRLDWNNFKKSEGIEEEIKTHNRGKDGYLEKQDFLQRTDLRQFEIEKQLRASRKHY